MNRTKLIGIIAAGALTTGTVCWVSGAAKDGGASASGKKSATSAQSAPVLSPKAASELPPTPRYPVVTLGPAKPEPKPEKPAPQVVAKPAAAKPAPVSKPAPVVAKPVAPKPAPEVAAKKPAAPQAAAPTNAPLLSPKATAALPPKAKFPVTSLAAAKAKPAPAVAAKPAPAAAKPAPVAAKPAATAAAPKTPAGKTTPELSPKVASEQPAIAKFPLLVGKPPKPVMSGNAPAPVIAKKPAVVKPVAKAPAVVKPVVKAPAFPIVGTIERACTNLNELIAPGAVIEQLADGFSWAEGPVWMGNHLLFSDVPNNCIYQWHAGKATLEIVPSGYTWKDEGEGQMGSNGLTRDRQGRLVLCQHGDRRVARLENGKFKTIAEYYQFHRFNSPNDLVYKSNGDLYFTDPPYGLKGQDQNPTMDLPYSGVYRVDPKGQVCLLEKDLKRPNGIAFSPKEEVLYVANSDPEKPVIMAYSVKKDGTLSKGWVFFDASELAKSGKKGLPDGMKVDVNGNLFATGPGGVLVISPEGKLLGTIAPGMPAANCAFGDHGTLYITANKCLLRVKTLTRGAAM